MRRLPVLFFFITIVALTLLRVAFYLVFRSHAPALTSHELLVALYLGLKFDARIAAIVTFPMVLTRRAGAAYVVVVSTLLLLLYAVDFGSYGYIHQRLNAGLLEFANNPLISMHMIWESYHSGVFIATLAGVVASIAFAVRRTVRAPREAAVGRSWVFALVLIACMYGKVSRYPLRWSDAYFSRNRFAGDLAMNPLQYLFETMREKPAAYDAERLRKLYPMLAAYLGVENPDPHALTFRRTPPIHPQASGSPNIVLIQLESFAAYKCGVFGNQLAGSPNIDAMARSGYLFRQHYSPSEKTARALFAVMFGIADVSPWQASAHNPLTVDQASIANAFTEYDKYYFLGGSANWSNIRGMLAHNLDGLKIYEEGSYDAKPVDVWGISDEELFLAANDVFRREQKPFFAIIQTSGNHRPYTIPKQTHGFVPIHASDEELQRNWFESNEELNSFRFLDHSIGLFLAAAKREPYFANTIFVLYGDHGTRTGAPGSALELGDLSPLVYHVPLIIYAPSFIRNPAMFDVPSSHMDILPTVASFCGRHYTNQTLGIDLFDPTASTRSAAFMFTTFHDPPDLEVIDPHGTTITRAQISTPTLGRALYEASRWLLYHNRP